MKVIWLNTAQKHVDEIYDFLAQQSLRAAADIYNDIIDVVDNLARFPEMGMLEPSLCEELHAYRCLIVRQTYKVIYRVNADWDEVIIVSVWDCRQNPETLKRKTKF